MTDFGPMNMRDPRSDPLSPEYSGWATDELSPDDSDAVRYALEVAARKVK